MALTAVVAGQRIITTDVNQIINMLTGVTGSGTAMTLIYNAASPLIFQPSSDPAADTVAVAIKNNAGTQQSGLTFDGNALLKTKLTFSAAASKIIPGATSFSHRNNADSADNLIISDAGVVTLRSLLQFTAATSQIVPGATSLSLRNNANNADNLIITDAGTVTIRQALVVPVSSYIAWGSVNVINNDGTFTIIRATGATNDCVITTTSLTQVGKVIVSGTVTAGGLLTNALQVGTSGPLIYSGSGAPSISAAVKGSLYMRTDGSGTTDRVYVAKDTAGAWASLTAAS